MRELQFLADCLIHWAFGLAWMGLSGLAIIGVLALLGPWKKCDKGPAR